MSSSHRRTATEVSGGQVLPLLACAAIVDQNRWRTLSFCNVLLMGACPSRNRWRIRIDVTLEPEAEPPAAAEAAPPQPASEWADAAAGAAESEVSDDWEALPIGAPPAAGEAVRLVSRSAFAQRRIRAEPASGSSARSRGASACGGYGDFAELERALLVVDPTPAHIASWPFFVTLPSNEIPLPVSARPSDSDLPHIFVYAVWDFPGNPILRGLHWSRNFEAYWAIRSLAGNSSEGPDALQWRRLQNFYTTFAVERIFHIRSYPSARAAETDRRPGGAGAVLWCYWQGHQRWLGQKPYGLVTRKGQLSQPRNVQVQVQGLKG